MCSHEGVGQRLHCNCRLKGNKSIMRSAAMLFTSPVRRGSNHFLFLLPYFMMMNIAVMPPITPQMTGMKSLSRIPCYLFLTRYSLTGIGAAHVSAPLLLICRTSINGWLVLRSVSPVREQQVVIGNINSSVTIQITIYPSIGFCEQVAYQDAEIG